MLMLNATGLEYGHSHRGVRQNLQITSLEGVWRAAVRAADLETSMLLSSRG
jgi:hypothetical protein